MSTADKKSLIEGSARPKFYAELAKKLAGQEWFDLDRRILQETLEDALGASLTPLAQARLFWTQEVSGEAPERGLVDPWLFEKVVCSFSGMIPDYEVWQMPQTEDLLEAMTYLRELLGKERIARIPDDIWRYIGACLLDDGCWCPPPGLEEAEPFIRSAMTFRGVELPSRDEVQRGLTEDAKNQREIWSSAQAQLEP